MSISKAIYRYYRTPDHLLSRLSETVLEARYQKMQTTHRVMFMVTALFYLNAFFVALKIVLPYWAAVGHDFYHQWQAHPFQTGCLMLLVLVAFTVPVLMLMLFHAALSESRALLPVVDMPTDMFREGIKLADKSLAAQAYRKAVLASGRQMRQFDLYMIRSLANTQGKRSGGMSSKVNVT